MNQENTKYYLVAASVEVEYHQSKSGNNATEEELQLQVLADRLTLNNNNKHYTNVMEMIEVLYGPNMKGRSLDNESLLLEVGDDKIRPYDPLTPYSTKSPGEKIPAKFGLCLPNSCTNKDVDRIVSQSEDMLVKLLGPKVPSDILE